MSQPEEKQGLDKKLLMTIGATVITGIVMFWVTQTQTTSDDLIGLVPVIEQNTRTIERHDDWISRWPTEGRLAADVAQDSQLVFLAEQISDLEIEIQRLEDRLRTIETRAISFN